MDQNIKNVGPSIGHNQPVTRKLSLAKMSL